MLPPLCLFLEEISILVGLYLEGGYDTTYFLVL